MTKTAGTAMSASAGDSSGHGSDDTAMAAHGGGATQTKAALCDGPEASKPSRVKLEIIGLGAPGDTEKLPPPAAAKRAHRGGGGGGGETCASDEFDAERHGTWKGVTADIITAVIGAGVLSVPYSMAVLGWPAGMLLMVIFAASTWYTAQLLASCCVWDGRRMRSYTELVRASMGRRHEIFFACVQYSNLTLSALAYNITGALSLQAVVCPAGGCEGAAYSYWLYAVVFALVQLVVTQLPNMDSLWWVATYGVASGSAPGIEFSTSPGKTFSAFNAIGAIAFAYSFAMLLVDMLDTVRRDAKGPAWHGHRAITVGLAIITAFYMLVAITGYLAFGDAVCGELLTCFAVAPNSGRVANIPLWTVRLANAMVFVHVISSYALFLQPVFSGVERAAARARPLLGGGRPRVVLQLLYRPACVAVLCLLAACLPFFNDIVGLIGAIGFWPATVFYPLEMYIRKHDVKGRAWWAMEALNCFCFVLTVLAILGSFYSIISNAASYTPFQSE